jgi:uncharacterized protein
MEQFQFTNSNSLKNASPQKQFLLLFVLVFVGLSIASFASLILGNLIWSYSMTDLSQLANNPSIPGAVNFLKLSQALSAVGVFIMPALIIRYYFKPTFQIDQKPDVRFLLGGSVFCMILMVLQTPLVNALAELNASLNLPHQLQSIQTWMELRENEAKELTELFLKMDSPIYFIPTVILLAVLPAIGEELLFRGSIQPLIAKVFGNQHLAIWLTAFIFSFIHFQFFGFIPRFVLGAFLGYLFYWGNSLVFPIAAHFANNALAVLLSYAEQHSILPATFQEAGTGDSAYIQALVSLAILIPSCYYFKKRANDLSL